MADLSGAKIVSTNGPMCHIAIIGGGFSGTTLAVQLMRLAQRAMAITVIDRSDAPGHGIAYAANRPGLLLNVPACRMSALNDDPDHFVRWLEASKSHIRPEQFAPRALYGTYLSDLFHNTCINSKEVTVSWFVGDALSLQIDRNNPRITLSDGTVITADAVVLATGNAPPSVPLCLRGLDRKVFAEYAWNETTLDNIRDDGAVLILGTGLTAIDQMVALQMKGFRGKIVAISRHGHLPAVYVAHQHSWPTDWVSELPGNINQLVVAIRRQVRLARDAGTDWRPVIDSLRPHIPILWARLSEQDKGRFLRHLQCYWANLRHRIPEQTLSLLSSLTESGRLKIIAGSLLSVRSTEQDVSIDYRNRGSTNVKTLTVDRIINCIGPGSPMRSSGPLFSQMMEQGLTKQDALGLGIETSAVGEIISAKGNALENLFAIGPVRKATLWETTAVPEIRLQAAELAETLLGTLTRQ